MNPEHGANPEHGTNPADGTPGGNGAPVTPRTTERSAADRASGPLLALSTVLIGLMAGLFFAFDVSVMPGLAAGDDRTYVTAMQHINAVIDGNGLFGGVFVLALLATAAAAVVEYRKGRRGPAVWAGAAAVAYLAVLVITFAVNIPLNNELADAGDAAAMTGFAVVDKFKGTWVTTNILRTLLCTAALTALTRALLLHGRSTPR